LACFIANLISSSHPFVSQDSDGNVFDGMFAEDRRVQGTYTLGDGSRYEMLFDSNDEAVAVTAMGAVGALLSGFGEGFCGLTGWQRARRPPMPPSGRRRRWSAHGAVPAVLLLLFCDADVTMTGCPRSPWCLANLVCSYSIFSLSL
jgi:hypothetical protein